MTDLLTRIPPQNVEAEGSVLGAILLDNDAVNAVLEVVGVDDFYRESHGLIFQAMVDLADRNQPVDAITLTDALRGRRVLECVGGPAYIAELAAKVPTAANATYYADIVRNKSILRRLASTCTQIASEIYDGVGTDVDGFVDTAERRIFNVCRHSKSQSDGLRPVDDVTREALTAIEAAQEGKGNLGPKVVTTGLRDLDLAIGGLRPGELIVLAARPAMGKSALAAGISQEVARKAPVAFFSLEMTDLQIVTRMLCSTADVDNFKLRAGYLSTAEIAQLGNAAARTAGLKLYIDDTGSISPTKLRARARRLAAEEALGLVVVDYIQLCGAESGRSREQEVSAISASLKSLALELRVPVLALAQLNRSVEYRENKRPMLSDLRESGAIEQDADTVLFLYRDDYYDLAKKPGLAEVIVAKQRNGPTTVVRVTWLGRFTRFRDYSHESEAGVAAS